MNILATEGSTPHPDALCPCSSLIINMSFLPLTGDVGADEWDLVLLKAVFPFDMFGNTPNGEPPPIEPALVVVKQPSIMPAFFVQQMWMPANMPPTQPLTGAPAIREALWACQRPRSSWQVLGPGHPHDSTCSERAVISLNHPSCALSLPSLRCAAGRQTRFRSCTSWVCGRRAARPDSSTLGPLGGQTNWECCRPFIPSRFAGCLKLKCLHFFAGLLQHCCPSSSFSSYEQGIT